MKKLLFVTFGAVAILLGSYSESLACSCSILSTLHRSFEERVKDARDDSKAVFSGTVLGIDRVPNRLSVTVKFKVERTWKGSLPEEMTIFTGQGGGDCGFPFEVGTTYLVYAYGDSVATLSTSICRRTTVLAAATEDLKILALSTCPTAKPDDAKFQILSVSKGKETQFYVLIKPKYRTDNNYIAVANYLRSRYCYADQLSVIYHATKKQWLSIDYKDPASTPLAIYYSGVGTEEKEGIEIYTVIDGKVHTRTIDSLSNPR